MQLSTSALVKLLLEWQIKPEEIFDFFGKEEIRREIIVPAIKAGLFGDDWSIIVYNTLLRVLALQLCMYGSGKDMATG